MKPDRASHTAAMVAAARALGAHLPREAQLALDPHGLRFVHPGVATVLGERAPLRAAVRAPSPLRRWIVYMQVRTRALDEIVRQFVDRGGRQVVLLGAGYDCRAHRLAEHLAQSLVLEVDHPATQRRKRRLLPHAGAPGNGRPEVRYLAWNFEQQPMTALGAALAALGHRAGQPTLTVWEGVTMYLTEDAIDATVRAVRALGGPGSQLAFTYFDRAHVDGRAPLPARLARLAVAQIGEPWRWGWAPEELGAWLAARELTLVRDLSMPQAAAQLLPARWAKEVHDLAPARALLTSIGYEHIALAEV